MKNKNIYITFEIISETIKNNNYYKIFILMICFFLINLKYKNYNKYKSNSSSYFSCFVTIVKLENKYLREIIEYYKKLGLNKFFIDDDNLLNSEK